MMNKDVFVFPGSFDILHVGHISMVHHIEEKYNGRVYFEICRKPFDKKELSDEEIGRRKHQFDVIGRGDRVIISEESSFVQKTLLVPSEIYYYRQKNCCSIHFMVGGDTFSRIIDKKYYFGSEKEMERCLKILSQRKFNIFPRNGQQIIIPNILTDVCTIENDFVEVDISSTQLRKEMSKNDNI